MLDKNTFRIQVKITIWDEYVDLQFGKSEFIFDVNEDGLPLFPKWVKKRLPPYIPETLVKMMMMMRSDHAFIAKFYLDVEHKLWCAELFTAYELSEIAICSCNPVLHDPEIREYHRKGGDSKATCDVCNECSTGQIGSFGGCETSEQFWVWKDGQRIRAYWTFNNAPMRLICDDCLNKERANTKQDLESF